MYGHLTCPMHRDKGALPAKGERTVLVSKRCWDKGGSVWKMKKQLGEIWKDLERFLT